MIKKDQSNYFIIIHTQVFYHGYNNMMKWIKNEVSYQEIAKNNTEEDLMAARHAVWYVEDEINGMVKSDEYDQNTMRKKFQEITGYKYNEIEKYIKDIRASQYKELTAAYDYKKSKQGTQGKTVGICDSYVTKFKYNKKQMSRLIDGIVQDCKAVGIETKTPNEIAEMLSRWEAAK